MKIIFTKTYLSLFVFLVLFSFGTYSQSVILPYNPKPARASNRTILDTAIVRIKYQMFSVRDTSDVNKKKENIRILQIGNRMSKYFDYYRFLSDSAYDASVAKKEAQSVAHTKAIDILSGYLPLTIFRDYPKGKITTTDRIPFNTYQYIEDIDNPEWKLEDGTSEVCGYVCKKATTTYFGRNYTVWYAPDIPISNGPWKLAGLPGLILKAEDDRGHYSYECISIEQPGWVDLIYRDGSNPFSIKKEQFFKQQKRYYDNPAGTLESTGMIETDLPDHARQAKPYNPIELSE